MNGVDEWYKQLRWNATTMHVVWTVHMLVGSVYILMMLGWGLSYLPYPPQRTATTNGS